MFDREITIVIEDEPNTIKKETRHQLMKIIQSCVSDYIDGFVKTEKDFCDYYMDSRYELLNDTPVYILKILVIQNMMDKIRAVWNIPTFGFEPAFGVNDNKMSLICQSVIAGVTKYPELINSKPSSFFIEFGEKLRLSGEI